MRLVPVALLVAAAAAAPSGRHLYVALPASDADTDRSVRLAVFDIADAHRFVKRVPLWNVPATEPVETVRGLAAHAGTGRLYLSTTARLAAIDLKTGKVLWSQRYGGHCCDRAAVSPDGRTIYAPAFGSAKWYVVAAATGELRASIAVSGWPRQTIYSGDGARVFLAAWDSRLLAVVDAATRAVAGTTGPFSASLCPFTVNAKGTLAFANVDGLVGFEVGDLQTGAVLDRVAATGSDPDAAKPYECPSHGIAFAPGERELWIADGVANRLIVFDAHEYPPVQRTAVELPAQPRWLAFSGDGRYVYPSTGDVVDAATKKIVGALETPTGAKVDSSVLVEVDRPPF
jgi:DNA-binding beta-propeller fold protein YncE